MSELTGCIPYGYDMYLFFYFLHAVYDDIMLDKQLTVISICISADPSDRTALG